MRKSNNIRFSVFMCRLITIASLCLFFIDIAKADSDEVLVALQRQLTEQVKSADLFLNGPQIIYGAKAIPKIDSLLSGWDELLERHPLLRDRDPWTYREAIFLQRFLKEIRVGLEMSAGMNDFEKQLFFKKSLLTEIREYLSWSLNPQNYPTRTPMIKLGSLMSLARLFDLLLDTRLDYKTSERRRLLSEVMDPAIRMLTDFLFRFREMGRDRFERFNSLLYRSTPLSIGKQRLYVALSNPEYHAAWVPDLSYVPSEPSNSAHAAFDFMLQSSMLYGVSEGQQEDRTPGLTRAEVLANIDDQNRYRYQLAWENFFPESWIEYLVSVPMEITHQSLIQHLSDIAAAKPNIDKVLKTAQFSADQNRGHLEQLLAIHLMKAASSWQKQVLNIAALIKAYFSGYLPPNSSPGDSPLTQTAAQQFAQATNAKSIISLLVQSLISQQQPNYRRFFERVLTDFIHLSKQLDTLSEADLSELIPLFQFYQNLEVRNTNVETLAKLVNDEPNLGSSDMMTVAEYLSHIDRMGGSDQEVSIFCPSTLVRSHNSIGNYGSSNQ